MKILSLFDGISIAQQAFKELGFEVEYYASEIDKQAISITQKNHPNTEQLGDIKDIDCTGGLLHYGAGKLAETDIYLLIGGSPCQDLSIAKKNREGLNGKRSGLFWEYVRILKELKPKYFILENVASMPKEAKQTITETLWDIEPVMINASLVSAQNRKRLFWVGKLTDKGHIVLVENWEYEKVDIPQPADKGILLKDILEDNANESYSVYNNKITVGKATTLGSNSQCFTAKTGQGIIRVGQIGKGGQGDIERLKSYAIDANYFKGGKIGGTHQSSKRNYTIRVGHFNSGGQGDRVYSPEGKSVGLSALGGGRGAKTGAMTSVQTDSMVMENTIIRKLTPIECERLQSLPEIEKSCIIRICSDHQNNLVSVVNQNLKSQGVAGNAEKTELSETAKFVVQNLNIKKQQENKPAQTDVLIICEENKIEIFNQGKLLANVSGAELKQNAPPLKSIEDFVRIVVGLNTIVGKTTPFGEAELPQRSNLLVVKESGNNVANIYGKGITQLAEDAKIDLTILKKLLKFTTSDLIGLENKEQITQILFSCVALAIVGYIPKEIQNQNILTFQIKSKVGYTYGISNTQRYKTLGNGFNCAVIKHIIKSICCI